MSKKLWIMVAGPYTSRANSPNERARNLSEMNKVALQIVERGHLPLIGVNLALPIIAEAGHDRFEEIMMPVSLSLALRCDAVIRIGGESKGADEEVQRICSNGGTLYQSVDDIPVYNL